MGVKFIEEGSFDKAFEALRNLEQAEFDVGLVEDVTREDGVSMTVVALSNEFGTQNIPASPALREAFDTNVGEIFKDVKVAVHKALKKQWGWSSGFRFVARRHLRRHKNTMERSPGPPNAPATLEQKDGDRRGIDTRSLIEALKIKQVK